jgi:hypothetical protein
MTEKQSEKKAIDDRAVSPKEEAVKQQVRNDFRSLQSSSFCSSSHHFSGGYWMRS